MREIWSLMYDNELYLFSTLDAAFESVAKKYPEAQVEMTKDDHFAVIEIAENDRVQDRVYVRKLDVHDAAVTLHSQAGVKPNAATAASVSADRE